MPKRIKRIQQSSDASFHGVKQQNYNLEANARWFAKAQFFVAKCVVRMNICLVCNTEVKSQIKMSVWHGMFTIPKLSTTMVFQYNN